MTKSSKALEAIKFPKWVKGDEEKFMKAIDVKLVSPDIQIIRKALQIWANVQSIIGFKVEESDQKCIDEITKLRDIASTFLSSYTITLLLGCKGWDKVTPEALSQAGPARELHKALEDALSTASGGGINIEAGLLAMASERVALGRSAA